MKKDPTDLHYVSCLDLFWTYFRIGLTTFGGGFAMATVLRHELVLKRKWLTEREFIDMFSVATAVPGAIGVNLAFIEGRRLRGVRGGISAVLGTTCPAVLVILLIARFGAPYFDQPRVAAFLKGCAIAVAGQIAFAAFTFARRLRRNWQNAAVCGLGLLVVGVGLHPVWAIAVAGGLGYLVMRERMMVREAGEDESALLKLIEGIPAQELVSGSFGTELRDVICSPDDGAMDRFDAIIAECPVLDIDRPMDAEEFLDLAAAELADELGADAGTLGAALKKREAQSATVLSQWLAVPHVVVEGEARFGMLMARSRTGVRFSEQAAKVQAIFVLVGSLDGRDFYLRALAAIAQAAADERFHEHWLRAEGAQTLRDAVLSARRVKPR